MSPSWINRPLDGGGAGIDLAGTGSQCDAPGGERKPRTHHTHTTNSSLIGSLCPPTQGSIFADAKCCEQRRRQVAAEEQVPNSNSTELELHHALFLPPCLNSGLVTLPQKTTGIQVEATVC